MKTKRILNTAACIVLVVFAGCRTVGTVERADTAKEGSLVFVRPDSFSAFGTKSVQDYIEIVYEKVDVDENGFAHLSVGVRNRGGQHFWDTDAPTVRLGAQASFYAAKGTDSAPIWQSNRRAFSLQRGETTHLKFDSPVKGALGYQVVFSDY